MLKNLRLAALVIKSMKIVVLGLQPILVGRYHIILLVLSCKTINSLAVKVHARSSEAALQMVTCNQKLSYELRSCIHKAKKFNFYDHATQLRKRTYS